jgi:hypothetical protein
MTHAEQQIETRKRRFQIFVIVLGILRMYLLGVIEGENQLVGVRQITEIFSTMGTFSLVLFSQVIDNIRNVRALFIAIEFALSFAVLSFGIKLVDTSDYSAEVTESARFGLVFLCCVYSLI